MADDDDSDLFEDFENSDDTWDVDDADDRTVLCAIHGQAVVGDLSLSQKWEVLHERYPEDLRIFAVYLYEAIYDFKIDGTSTVLTQIERFADAGKGKVDGVARDILASAQIDVNDLDLADGADAKDVKAQLAKLQKRLGVPEEDSWAEDGPHRRMLKYEKRLVRVLHDVTLGGKPIATKPRNTVIASSLPALKYSADVKLVPGVRVQHPKFGLGVVQRVEERRATILFPTGEKKLFCG